jgi:hypothetical protein
VLMPPPHACIFLEKIGGNILQNRCTLDDHIALMQCGVLFNNRVFNTISIMIIYGCRRVRY